MWGVGLGLGVYTAIGLLVHLAEKRWPLRSYEKPRAWKVDTFGTAFGIAVSVIFQKAYPHTFARLSDVPGLQWIKAASQFVTTNIPWPVAFIMSAVVLDFLLYLTHRLLHTSYLWHTHAAHHSVEHLYWFGGMRSSPLHVILPASCGALLGLILPVTGGMTGTLATLILYACIQHFNHANLRWRFGPLEWLFVVPRYHFVHHGAEAKLNNSNFGFLLTVWDRIFGTYTNPDDVEENFPLGLDYEIGMPRLFLGLPPESAKAPETVAPRSRLALPTDR